MARATNEVEPSTERSEVQQYEINVTNNAQIPSIEQWCLRNEVPASISGHTITIYCPSDMLPIVSTFLALNGLKLEKI